MTLAVRVLGANASEYASIRQWRERYIGDNPAKERDYERREIYRNGVSFQFAFYRGDELVGSVRFTPVGHGLTLTEELVDLRRWFPPRCRLMEVGRLLLREDQRGGRLVTDALRDCFGWIRENTAQDGLVALCRPVFVPLYRRVGARVVENDIPAPGDPAKRYSLISMLFKETL
ncbi:MAG: GNAT family N-acetyltransferase [Lysobacter sp.]|nr:GNAT family N-acetyltransferase [Lysobacter sp.]